MSSAKIHHIFQSIYKLFFITYSLHALSKPRQILEYGFYGLLIFPISFINLIDEAPDVLSEPKIAIITIALLLLSQFSAFNFLIFGKIKKPKLKHFFIQTDKLIYQMEAHTNGKITFHNYFRRKSNFMFAVVAIFNLLVFYNNHFDWGNDSYSGVKTTVRVIFDISHVYFNLWLVGPCFITNCTCMEIYIKLIFVLKQNKCKYCQNFYLMYNRIFKNIDNFYTIFDTMTVVLIGYAFLDLIYCNFWIITYGNLSSEFFLFLFVFVLVVFLLVQHRSYLFQGVSISVFNIYRGEGGRIYTHCTGRI